jgi:ribosomal protein S18 acetylase RimI-like enzyme
MTDLVDVEKVVIRPLEKSELPALEWDGAYTKFRRVYQQTYDEVERGQRLMLVAADGDRLVGQIFIQFTSADQSYADGFERAYLYSLRVRPEWQGHGLGTRLLEAAESILRARGFRIAVIAAAKDNAGAYRLYLRQGYRAFAEDPGVWYFTDVNGVRQTVEEPCWVLEKRLKPERKKR